MLRTGPLLLVATLVLFGASAPFAHTHAHGAGQGDDSAPGPDTHCDRHHRQGAHWHPPGTTTDEAAGGAAIASTHRHSAVAFHAGAVKPDPPRLPHAVAVTEARDAAVAVDPGGAPPTTAAADGPDPPPRAAAPARAPPPAC